MYAHKHPEPTDPRVGPAIVYLIVGLPGAGKTTRAKELETSSGSNGGIRSTGPCSGSSRPGMRC
jgi:adenylylsulfate kinase-like enzyme